MEEKPATGRPHPRISIHFPCLGISPSHVSPGVAFISSLKCFNWIFVTAYGTWWFLPLVSTHTQFLFLPPCVWFSPDVGVVACLWLQLSDCLSSRNIINLRCLTFCFCCMGDSSSALYTSWTATRDPLLQSKHAGSNTFSDMPARTTGSLFSWRGELDCEALLLFSKHTCAYLCLPETSSCAASLLRTIVFPFWKRLRKIGMKIEFCFNQGLCIPTWGVWAGRIIMDGVGPRQKPGWATGIVKLSLRGAC